MTRNLTYFTAFAAVWVAAFFAVLFAGINRGDATSSTYISLFVVFVVVLNAVQRFFAGHDSQRSTRINLAAHYAAISAGASLVVTAGWLLAWHENIWLVVLAALASIGVVWLTAAGMSKGRIKGSRKEDLFQ